MRALRDLGDGLMTPALVIDLDAVDHNVSRISEAVGGPSRWRPHIKTIKQSALIERLLIAGVRRFKCATVDELALLVDTAAAAAAEGVDVLLAHPPTTASLQRLPGPRDAVQMAVLADHPEHAGWLAARLAPHVSMWLDVDLGMHRTGSSPQTWLHDPLPPAVMQRLAGLHGYDGHLRADQRTEAHAGYDRLTALAQALGVPQLERCTSGSHSYAHALAHPGLAAANHTVSPGTLVLSDLRSEPAHTALDLRYAAYVASRVISQPTSGRITLDAGSKAISPDTGVPSCALVGWPDARPQGASEEHLPVLVGTEAPAAGTVCLLLPTHVCTTVNLHTAAVLLRSGQAPRLSPIEARGRPSPLTEVSA